METTGQGGQVGRPTPRSADQGKASLAQSGRPTRGWLPDPLIGPPDLPSQPLATSLIHIMKKNTSALKSNRKTKHPMYPKAKNAPSHGSTTSSIRGRSKVANARLTRGRSTSYKVGRPTLGGILHMQQPS
ncbi:hypothetical protein U9M48_000850 [Paspalum notatum var. saurae]|uniref:Uncharacterized protein n=1 Tax=Paspalum notatum var. saurae TaxID=547442 RepID=A0AAQ3SCL0_PASNO